MLREMQVVVPGDSSDLYRRHQRVWEAVDGQARTGQDFLFWKSAPGLFVVRGKCLPKRFSRTVRLQESGRFEIDMISVRRHGQAELPVPQEVLAEWFEARAAQSGFAFSLDMIQPLGFESGTKRYRDTERSHLIRLPAARFSGLFRITDRLQAESVFAEGLGRGRRFGYGMLRVSA